MKLILYKKPIKSVQDTAARLSVRLTLPGFAAGQAALKAEFYQRRYAGW